jgi:hypothetical protein
MTTVKKLRQICSIARFALESRENLKITLGVVAIVLLGFRPVGGAVRRG